MDLIDTNRSDVGEVMAGEPPLDGALDGPVHGAPTRLECRRDIAPAKALRPSGEEPLKTPRHSLLAIGPRHHLNGDAAGPAVYAAHGINEKDEDGPERDVLEPARRQSIVVPPLDPAARAVALAADPRSHVNK